MTLSRSGSVVLAAALAACGGGGPPAPAAPAPPVRQVDAWTARHEVRWGYGCGAGCAFSHTGRSTIGVVLRSDHGAEATDAGTAVHEQRSPDGATAMSRWWRHRWRGTWSGDERARTLRLAVDEASCESSTAGAPAVPCEDRPAALELACAHERVAVGDNVPEGTPPEQRLPPRDQFAWVCRAGDGGATTAGSELPWVFGIDVGIRTVHSGEPRPETSYVHDLEDEP